MIPALREGNPSWEKLWNCRDIRPTSNDARIVLYVRLYKGIENTGFGDNGDYAGKTTSFGTRMVKHDFDIRSAEKGTHHAIAATADETKVLLFATFLTGTPQLAELLQVGEQILLMLLNSCNPVLLSTSGNFDTQSKYYSDTVAARGLHSLASGVFATTGYMPPTSIHGLNWSSPITEGSRSKSLWTVHNRKDEDGRPMQVFTTAGKPRRLCRAKSTGADSQRSQIQLIRGGSKEIGMVLVELPLNAQEQGLVAGTMVYPIVEFYTEPQSPNGPLISHPHPFGRLPVPGPYSDWVFYNRFGKHVSIFSPVKFLH